LGISKGSGIRCLLTPGSGIRNRFFPNSDPGPKPIFLRAYIDNVLSKTKNFYNSLKIGPSYFLQHFKNKIIFNFVKFVATKNGMTTNFFSTLSFVAVFGSGIRDKHPRSAKNGSKNGKCF
jgi:hypothetical protein